MNANDPKTSPPPLEDNMRLLTVEEVCEITKLHERTVRLWMSNGKLPFVRLGDGKAPPVRVRYRDLMAIMKPGTGAPAA